jgi:uncharacterized protein (TIGR02757 family)
MSQTFNDIKVILDCKEKQYNNLLFIENDPVQVPHLFIRKEDIEIAGFLTSAISWGNRKTIIKNSMYLMKIMDNSPYDFIMSEAAKKIEKLPFVHRTFNGFDMAFFIRSLHNIYTHHGGLEEVFMSAYEKTKNIKDAICHCRQVFLDVIHEKRSEKHFPDISKKASCKRINMFLRWMVRKDTSGVDFGIWNKISMSDLYIPLDIHTSNTARKLGILTRKSNDWKAVEELTECLKSLDSADPIKYDFALFGIGIDA